MWEVAGIFLQLLRAFLPTDWATVGVAIVVTIAFSSYSSGGHYGGPNGGDGGVRCALSGEGIQF